MAYPLFEHPEDRDDPHFAIVSFTSVSPTEDAEALQEQMCIFFEWTLTYPSLMEGPQLIRCFHQRLFLS